MMRNVVRRLRTRPAPIVLSILALATSGAGVGCRSDAPARSEILWRLVDAGAADVGGEIPPAPATFRPDDATPPRGPSRAVIADDMRYTFERPEWRLLFRNQHLEVPADGRVRLEVPIPPTLAGCDRLMIRASLAGAAARDTRSALGTCTGSGASARATFAVEAPPTLRGQPADVWVQAQPAPRQPVSRRSFHLDSVPSGARLSLAYGVEAIGWEVGAPPATFVVRADGVAAPLLTATLDPAKNAEHRKWTSADVPLDTFAGGPLTLTFETSSEGPADAHAMSAPVWGDPTIILDRPSGDGRRWNVLLVSLDTLRAKSVSAYGHDRKTTPFFDALAEEGALFENAMAQSTLTPVSNMSMFSALYPHRHGVTDLSAPADAERVPTLPEQLRRAGYATGAITEDGLLQPALGFERGVDDYVENKSPDVGSTVGQIERTFAESMRWMQAHRTLPFFLFVQTYQVHSPYTPPPPYRGAFGPLDATGPTASVDRYEEEIRYTDDWLAKLWDSVRTMGLADRTVLIVTSDHGEEFGEHGALDHGAQLYDETLHVPLLVRAPGIVPPKLRVRAPVALIDLAPTLLDLLGLPRLANVDGRTLAGLFKSDPREHALLERELSTRLLFAEAWAATRMRVDGTLDPTWHPPIYALRSAMLKLILTPALPATNRPEALEVYDLTQDPSERRPSGAGPGLRLRTAEKALRNYVADAAAPKPVTRPSPVAPADPETTEKLRALGYLR